ncbi:MAG TPA: hypothetical protein VGC41_27690 [Kofleriaceae bacterium]
MLFVTPAVTAIVEALQSARAEGTLAVVGDAKLALGLAKHAPVIAVGVSERAAKKLPDKRADFSAVDERSLSAIVGVDIADNDAWETLLREWTRRVRDGGVIILVDRGHAPEASRRALCSGLCELEQRHSGRLVITSGLVSHLS